ncbi:MAG: hypothetical protein V3T08_09500 [Gemmatimonadota bacterium]
MADEFKNVWISIYKDFEDNLGTVSNIDLPGVDFDTDAFTEWFRPRLLGPAGGPARRGERNEIWTLDVGCFAKVGEDFTGAQKEILHRHWTLADAVFGQYSQADIAVKNWAGVGDPVIAHMRFEEASMVQIERDTMTKQVTVTVAGRLIF